MEITVLGNKSLRIKSKNTSFVINPEKKIDDDVVVLTAKCEDYTPFSEKLVIGGQGDYEIAGVSIRGEMAVGGISYDFSEEGQRLVVLSTAAIAASKETEDATAAVVILDDSAKDNLSKVSCEIVAVVGEDNFLPADRANIKKLDRLNLKKTEEYKGFILHLSK